MSRPAAPPAVLVVSSHVVRGAVGGRAAFALERLGFRLWSMPTVLLPWHPGHGRAHRIVAPPDDFSAFVDDIAASPRLGEIGAVLTGYLGAATQAEPVARLIRAVKAANPAAIHLADPVVGDEGGLYVGADIAAAQRETLMPLADIATPNRFELAHLTGMTTDTMPALVSAARALGPATMLVTSAPALMRGKIGVALVGPGAVLTAENPLVPGAPSGTGDLFAALFLARRLWGQSDAEALSGAVAATYETVARSVAAGADELELAAEQAVLERPSAPVDVRTFAEPRRPARRT
ncbi:MAG TPA: pyridoxal kinase [Methylomirabilota bacterium]|nr:pyridoxal kinase [Methylomirabilota bacterium]